MPREALYRIYKATTLARLLYASSAWMGFADKEDIHRMEAFLRKSAKVGYYQMADDDLGTICQKLDNRLFNKILHNCQHVLFQMLPPLKSHGYGLRARRHNHSITLPANSYYKSNFVSRMLLYKSY